TFVRCVRRALPAPFVFTLSTASRRASSSASSGDFDGGRWLPTFPGETGREFPGHFQGNDPHGVSGARGRSREAPQQGRPVRRRHDTGDILGGRFPSQDRRLGDEKSPVRPVPEPQPQGGRARPQALLPVPYLRLLQVQTDRRTAGGHGTASGAEARSGAGRGQRARGFRRSGPQESAGPAAAQGRGQAAAGASHLRQLCLRGQRLRSAGILRLGRPAFWR
ncbi:unnamed protein product, partial [Ixodes persulcatus]